MGIGNWVRKEFEERTRIPDRDLGQVMAEAMIATLEVQREILHLLKQQHPQYRPTTRFIITQVGAPIMGTQQTLAGLAPGTSGTLTIQPVDTNGLPTTLPTGTVPAWSFSDTNVQFTPSADGLSCAVSVPKSDIVNPTATVTVALPDGSASTTAVFPIDPAAVTPPPPPAPVAGFTFTQS